MCRPYAKRPFVTIEMNFNHDITLGFQRLFKPTSKYKQIIRYNTLTYSNPLKRIDMEPVDISIGEEYQATVELFAAVSKSLHHIAMEVSILRANRNYIYLVFGQQLSGHSDQEKKRITNKTQTTLPRKACG